MAPTQDGWTRVAHSGDAGVAIVWDVAVPQVIVLAAKASKVKIQQADAPEMHVVSKTETYAIQDLRAGHCIGTSKCTLDGAEVTEFWESPTELLTSHCLSHTQPLTSDLQAGIYHATGNPTGLHWIVDPSHHRWAFGDADVKLELWLDAVSEQEPDEDEPDEADFAELASYMGSQAGPPPGLEDDAVPPPPGYEDGREDWKAATPKVLAQPDSVENQEVEVTFGVSDPDLTHLYAITNWEELGLDQKLLDGIYETGFAKPAKIQEWALPLAMKGANIIAQAINGSGKTAAFALSMLARIKPEEHWTQGLCLCHTRELATQNVTIIKSLGSRIGLEYELCVAGSNPRWVQAHVVVGTPGKIEGLVRGRALDIRWLRMLVIDEADHMIDAGSSGKTVLQLHKSMPKDVQTLLFSATWPAEVMSMAAVVAPDASKIMVKKEDLTLKDITQHYISVADDDAKLRQLSDIYGTLTLGQSIIFVNTRWRGLKLARLMKKGGFAVSLICGTQTEGREKMELWQRDRCMKQFRDGVTKVLISTDILARGIDVPAVTLVINYDVPREPGERGSPVKPGLETYLHRIGRTGRFGLRGIAVNLCTPPDKVLLDEITAHYGSAITELSGDVEQMEEIMRKSGRFA